MGVGVWWGKRKGKGGVWWGKMVTEKNKKKLGGIIFYNIYVNATQT